MSTETPDREAGGKLLKHAAGSCAVKDTPAPVDSSPLTHLAQDPVE